MTNHIVSQFIKIPANKASIGHRKLVYGVGINDADYITNPTISGKRLKCPLYRTWHHVIERCHSEKLHARKPTYIDCTIAEEWLTFSIFAKWMCVQDWLGKELDKDILKPGNKHYSPETCVFVTPQVNTLLNDSATIRGEFPQGVSFNICNNSFQAYCKVNSKLNHLGCFKTPEEAEAVYKKFKSNHIIEIANQQTDIRIKNGLLLHAELILKKL